MRTTFRRWLFLNIFFIFLLTFFLAFRYHTREADKDARVMINLKISDTIENLKVYQKTCLNINDIVESDAKVTLNAFAEMLCLDPTILTSQSRLKEIAGILDVSTLSVSDDKGVLIATIPEDHLGFHMDSTAQSREFMEALTNPDFFLFQKPQPRGKDNVFFQYAGKARKDKPGIIQYGDTPDWFAKIESTLSIENIAPGFRIGTSGKIIILHKSGKIVSIDHSEWIGKDIRDLGVSAENFNGEQGEFHAVLKRDKLLAPDNIKEDDSDDIEILCIYRKLGDYIVAGVLPTEEIYVSRNQMEHDMLATYAILFIALFFLISWLVDKVVIRGITHINQSLTKITNGDLNELVNVRNNPEFISLSDGINSTVGALKNAIAETAARIDKEIGFARAIQSASLPVLDPYPFENRSDFALYATMDTAKGVGGDLYDFLMIDDDHIAVVIADVSGKGIPASLFMMKAKAILRGEINSAQSTDEMITKANDLLSENNTSAMFVTTFLGVIELSTGKFTATNAGHNAPVLIRRGEKPVFLDISGGVILGAMEGMEYEKSELTLQPGDRLYLYTDGVTEALNPQGELLGDTRLLEFLAAAEVAELSPEALLRYVQKRLREYVSGAPQSDDITMMVIEYKGAE